MCPHDFLIYGTFQTTTVPKKYANKKCSLFLVFGILLLGTFLFFFKIYFVLVSGVRIVVRQLYILMLTILNVNSEKKHFFL